MTETPLAVPATVIIPTRKAKAKAAGAADLKKASS